MNTKGLKTKDLITIGLLSICNILLSFVGSILAFSPYAYMAAFPIMALLGGVIFFLLAARVPKPGAFLIYGLLVALIYLVLGYVPLAITLAIGAVIIEVIARRFRWEATKAVTVCYMVECFAFALGSYIPYLMFADQMVEEYAEQFGKEYMEVSAGLVTPQSTIILLCINLLCAFIGAMIARRLLKKHFAKAGKI